jgi:uncharacterized protein YuzE
MTTVYVKTSIPLVCTYDSDADATYVYLEYPLRPGAVHRTQTFNTSIGMLNLDIDAQGHVIGLEIIGSRAHVPAGLLRAFVAHGQTQFERDS